MFVTPQRLEELILLHAEMRKVAYVQVLPRVLETFEEAGRRYQEKTASETEWPIALRLHLESR